MYDIRQFKPVLFVVLVLGMTGFAIAAGSPSVWVLSLGAVTLNGWLVKTARYRPMPRFVANIVTLLALIYVVALVRQSLAAPIVVIGQFLVLLQIIKLYECRGNRDYAQLLVLSLLLMVSSMINTASLLFGIVLIAYLFLALFCCLLFHLKVETDHAKIALGISEDRINPQTLRQDQRYLTRSMRRITGIVAAVSITTAVVVFLLFPRGTAAGIFGPLGWKPGQTLSGFSTQMNYQTIAAITQSNEKVADVKVWHNEVPVTAGPVYLRGITHDVYTGNDTSTGAAWSWIHAQDEVTTIDTSVQTIRLRPDATDGSFRQEIGLLPTGTPVLFAMAGVVQIAPQFGGKVHYVRRDETIQVSDPATTRLNYTVVSRGFLESVSQANPPRPRSPNGRPIPMLKSNIDPQIEAFARRPEVSGHDGRGSFADRRPKNARTDPLDESIAVNIDTYLRSQFTYTLDLTDAQRVAGRDPLVAFLYDLKRGHCEYFAGAMTLMCQSLGMQARVVVGFRGDEYNQYTGAFQVKGSDAHAWVEVLFPDGQWHSFDPTSGTLTPDAQTRAATLWERVKHMFDFLEYTWANSVVAYDNSSRQSLIDTVDRKFSDSATGTQSTMQRLSDWLTTMDQHLSAMRLVPALTGFLVFAVVASLAWIIFDKWRLRRRARRIGLDTLSHADQVRLAKQLGFYDDLIQLLERHEIHRPTHLTPLEFSETVTFLPNEVFDAIRRLTLIFYRIRYGEAELSPDQRRRLGNVLARIETSMQAPGG
jgi:protein-glutamine gamma-glutamyltransferase